MNFFIYFLKKLLFIIQFLTKYLKLIRKKLSIINIKVLNKI